MNSSHRENGSKKERALLLIAYKFPPMQSISCNRTWALYTGLKRYFDAIYVVSTSNRHILPQDPVDTSGVDVTDAKTVDYRTLFQGNSRSAVAGERTKTSLAGKVMARMQSSFPTLHLFGEGNFYYVNNAVAAAERILRKHPVTHVLSTFPPYADHLIASALKKRHAGIFWIADFRDLHVDPAQNNLFWRKHQENVNRRILRAADMVTTVSEGLAEHLRRFHPNVHVLKNGISTQRERYELPFPKFTIAYTGSMFQDKRKPETLLEAVRELLDNGTLKKADVDIAYAGKDSAVWWPLIRRYHLEEIFTDYGMLSHDEAERIQQRSHINVLLTYSTDTLKGNLTGKLFDYLAARRPILVIVNGPRDKEIEDMISTTKSGKVCYHGDRQCVAEILAHLYREWQQRGDVNWEYSKEHLEELSWDHILKAFSRNIAEATHLVGA